MALEDTPKAPPAKVEPATTTAAVDVVGDSHPAPVPVPADLPSHQVRARTVPFSRLAAVLAAHALRCRAFVAHVPCARLGRQVVHHQVAGTAVMGAPVLPFAAGPVVVEQRVVGKKLKPEGWLAVCVLAFVFWPLMCVPCCIPACQEDVVETVYIAVRTRCRKRCRC